MSKFVDIFVKDSKRYKEYSADEIRQMFQTKKSIDLFCRTTLLSLPTSLSLLEVITARAGKGLPIKQYVKTVDVKLTSCVLERLVYLLKKATGEVEQFGKTLDQLTFTDSFYSLCKSQAGYYSKNRRWFKRTYPGENYKVFLKDLILIEDCDKAVDKIITTIANSNLMLVLKGVHMSTGKAARRKYMEQLLSAGAGGLVKAIQSFDPDAGTNFTTYAYRCITRDAMGAMTENKFVKIPKGSQDSFNKIRAFRAEQTAKNLGVEPSLDEISEALNLKKSKIISLLEVGMNTASLESMASDSEERHSLLSTLITSDTVVNPYLEETAEDAVNSLGLTEEQRRVVHVQLDFLNEPTDVVKEREKLTVEHFLMKIAQ